MKRMDITAEGLGTGAALILVFAAVSWLWKPDVVGGWLVRETDEARERRSWQRAEKLAHLSSDYLDICRAAGL